MRNGRIEFNEISFAAVSTNFNMGMNAKAIFNSIRTTLSRSLFSDFQEKPGMFKFNLRMRRLRPKFS